MAQTTFMTIPAPQRSLLSILDYFNQATTSQLRSLVFPTAKSRTSCDLVLKRLMKDGYVIQVERRRLIGGGRGGSGEYIWALGPVGWKLCEREGRFRREGAVNYHALTVTDLYVKLRQAERAGELKINGFTPEPESWENVRGTELKPDLFVELERPGTKTKLICWLEVDMSTQRPARLSEKMDRYARAYRDIGTDQLARLGESFPLVIFVCHGEERQREIADLIERRNDDPALFRSVTIDNFPPART